MNVFELRFYLDCNQSYRVRIPVPTLAVGRSALDKVRLLA